VSESVAQYGVSASEPRILTIRGERVVLDAELARVYGVETKALNRAVKRNARRFPADFIFRLTNEEDEALRRQIGTSNGRGGRRYTPYAFTGGTCPPFAAAFPAAGRQGRTLPLRGAPPARSWRPAGGGILEPAGIYVLASAE
jgi:hypothetical protein